MTSSLSDIPGGWLERVYASSNPDAWVNVFMDTGRHVESAWAQVAYLARLRPHIERFTAEGNVWYSVATRKDRQPGQERGGQDDCAAMPGLFLDVDVDEGNGAHKLPNLPTSYEAAQELIERFPLAPTAVVRSGYGMQPYWLLSEPLEASQAPEWLRRWQLTWDDTAAQLGYHLDKVSDLPRMMRLPGTVNRKLGGAVPVTYKARWDRLYQLSDLDDVLALVPTAPPKAERAYTKHLAGSKFSAEVTCDDVLTMKGCPLVANDGNQRHYHWPGATNERSFTVYDEGEDQHATCWSETAAAETGIALQRPYDSFGLWTWLYYAGDFVASHAALLREGWPEAGASRMATEAPRKRPRVRYSSTPAGLATPVDVGWVWENWLPRGKLTTLDGDPATGKSTMALDIASRVTRGGAMPDGSMGGAAGSVILLAAEDDLEDTILWRLMAAGADTMAIHYVGGVVDIPGDVDDLERDIVRQGAVLVIIDVLMEYLDTGVDSYRDQSTRHALAPLRAMAKRTNVAVLMLRHFTKGTGVKAMHKGGGSIAMVGASRAGWAVGYLEEDEVTRVLVPIKSNLGPKPRAQGFQLRPHDVYPCAYVQWTGPVDVSAEHLVNPPAPPPPPDEDEVTALAFACDVLAQVLTPEWQWTDEVLEQIKEWHIAEKTLKRARARLGVEAHQFGRDMLTGHEKGWKMRLVIAVTGSEGQEV